MSLRPFVSEACRAAWEAGGAPAADAHKRRCAFCRDRARARRAFEPLLRVRPAAPVELAKPAFLEGIYARAAEAAEQGPLGRWVEDAPAPRVEATPELGESFERSDLARSLLSAPPRPDAAVWSGVRDQVLAEVSAEGSVGSSRRKLRSWRGLAASAAAAAVLAVISLSDGTPDEPRIVFTELGKVPDVPFAIVRHGAGDGYR